MFCEVNMQDKHVTLKGNTVLKKQKIKSKGKIQLSGGLSVCGFKGEWNNG